MARSALVCVRFLALSLAALLSATYLHFVLPLDTNAMDLKACTVQFISAYMVTTGGMLVFSRVRKFDVAIFCWATLSAFIMAQFCLFAGGFALLPQISQALSGAMGILACLLPMCIVGIRGDARSDHYISRYIVARRMTAPTANKNLLETQ